MSSDNGVSSQPPVPNDLLRGARSRVPSQWDPGECLSRQELAELVAAHVWEHYGEEAGLDDKYIGKLERGEIRWPGRRYREALRAILGAETDRELGFRPPTAAREKDVEDDMHRRELMRSAAALGGLAITAPSLAASALLEAIARAPVPDQVGEREIEEVRTAAGAVTAWSFAHGGALALRAGEGQLRWATQLLGARCPERLRPTLNSAVSRLADACGFAAFDSHLAFGQARRMLRAAHLCAEAGGNWALRASALVDTALLALWLGEADEALTYTDLALVRSERLAPAEAALVWATRAEAHAQMGDAQATLAAIGRADAHFWNAGPGDETPLTWYTSGEHDLMCGRALYELTRTTGVAAREAEERQLSGIARLGDEHVRSRVLAQARLAVIVMLAGDPDEAAGIGLEALTGAGPIRSARTREYFRVLGGAAAKHSGRPLVDHLRERTGAFLAA
jgi:hypothetical protein